MTSDEAMGMALMAIIGISLVLGVIGTAHSDRAHDKIKAQQIRIKALEKVWIASDRHVTPEPHKCCEHAYREF